MKLKLIFGNYYKIYNLKGENNMHTGFKSLDEIIEINKGDLVIATNEDNEISKGKQVLYYNTYHTIGKQKRG